MRRVIGALMFLAGAYALYWTWLSAGRRLPNHFALRDPVTQYAAFGLLFALAGIAVFRSYKPPLKNTVICPNCKKLLQKGRRSCPHCNEQLIHY